MLLSKTDVKVSKNQGPEFRYTRVLITIQGLLNKGPSHWETPTYQKNIDVTRQGRRRANATLTDLVVFASC